MAATEFRIEGMRIFTADWMKPDEALIVPTRRTLETDDEYWQRAQSQAVLIRNMKSED